MFARDHYIPKLEQRHDDDVQGPIRYGNDRMLLDNFARVSAERGLANDPNFILNAAVTRDIIQEMLIGWTVPEEEDLIVKLLKAADYEDLRIIMSDERNSRVGYPRVRAKDLRRKIQKHRPALEEFLDQWNLDSIAEADARTQEMAAKDASSNMAPAVPSLAVTPKKAPFNKHFETKAAADLAGEIVADFKARSVEMTITSEQDVHWTVADPVEDHPGDLGPPGARAAREAAQR